MNVVAFKAAGRPRGTGHPFMSKSTRKQIIAALHTPDTFPRIAARFSVSVVSVARVAKAEGLSRGAGGMRNDTTPVIVVQASTKSSLELQLREQETAARAIQAAIYLTYEQACRDVDALTAALAVYG